MANQYGGQPPGGVPPGNPAAGYPQAGHPGQPQAGYPQAGHPGQPQAGYPQAGHPGQPQAGMPGPASGQQMMAPGQQMAHAGGASVMGVPLQPGERVVYFYKPSYSGDKIAYWFLFVLCAVILIGFYFLYLALTIEKTSPKAQIVTTLRVIVVPGEGEAVSYPLQQVADVEPERQRTNTGGGGGLLGAVVRAGVTAVANNMADGKAKVERGYWTRAISVFLIEHSGTRHKVVSKDAVNLGVFLATGMYSGGFNQAPDVPFDA